MISETSFSRGYSSFWLEHTPWLSDFVSSINQGIVERVFIPLGDIDDPKFRSANNVIAFTLFKNKYSYGINNINDSFEEAEMVLKYYPRNGLDKYQLNKVNKSAINKLCDRLLKFYSKKSLVFNPKFAGCGILENCEGDVHFDNTLVEVKAGDRGFSPIDVRQLIVYSALNWLSSKPYSILEIELFNPRQGLFWNENIEDLILTVSSLPMEDLFDSMGKYLSELSDQVEIV